MRFPSLACALLLALLTVLPPSLTLPVPINIHHSSRQADNPHPDVPRVPPQFNINSGGPASGRFVADDPSWITGHTSAFVIEDAAIGGAEERNQVMYKSHRYGLGSTAWGYDLPVMEPGVYGCTIHFAETHADAFAVGVRVFDLKVSTSIGQPTVFSGIDIFKELEGAEFTVLTKTVLDLVVPGYISIRVSPSAGDAIISGVTCERTADLPEGIEPDFSADSRIPTSMVGETEKGDDEDPEAGAAVPGTEININAGGPEVGRFSAEDYDWIFGTTSMWGGPEGIQIGGAEEKNVPALISQRYGVDGSTWGYRIPIDTPGVYACSLHFAETDSESFEIGARVFNVRVQDSQIDSVDVYSESGEAPFTSVVKTFVELKVANELYIELSSVTGNAFLSAITCERTGELAVADAAGSSMQGPRIELGPSPEVWETSEPVPSPPVVAILPSAVPSPAPVVQSETDDVIETPEMTADVAATAIEEETAAVETPTPQPTSDHAEPEVDLGPSSSPAPTVPGVGIEDVSKEDDAPILSPSPSQSPFPLDDRLTAEGSEKGFDYMLRGDVSDGGEFTLNMKDALITLSEESTLNESRWAFVNITKQEPEGTLRILQKVSYRQVASSVYDIDLQVVYRSSANLTEEIATYTKFIAQDVNEQLRNRGIENLNVTFRQSPLLQGAASVADVSRMSTIVGIIVGCVLGLLLIIALVAFFVVRRSRNSPNAAAFDAPPPMTESEVSSVMERSETGASIEYLDDDSTFTAATSRAGDHVDQVAIDKDVFGRRSSPES
eukprot:GFKZ01009757.1.p1 GENE.GFKZ01009757.1~~GFKZ01009757.1.p1  ORF type:complete len:782 (+),score=108.35 GFKZ01009757.1:422-2767(+)